ncbi:hypothetical protein [Agrobacterium tumefaciens]|uniref:hypothetical protein n=1 Tax=Agrobacterium tumefaciens TaxID=358 RepID=UPI0015747FD4|nr:hypothetical protein [Agrobacterium tumefaciens]NTD88377.1 hypothetical protein [Agrobacterium tumefaciens]NTD91106.1 hypothetical protein [Agrobacterium tumefaciens]NTD98552.1 hypothetical protein [Agrobacterium tumefaciens]NTE11934.1 hypothetical protein [Agrobacterium tumefaciens]NTE20010.1 hypothetical protein [Agrobacterium tumefaciens]
MKFYKLGKVDMDWLAKQPESAMGLQLIDVDYKLKSKILYVAGGQAVFDFTLNDDDDHSLLDEPWMKAGSQDKRLEGFRLWLDKLEQIEIPGHEENRRIVPISSRISPSGRFVSQPQPRNIYGHLPYRGSSDGTDVFYRWEPFPSSRRIDQITGQISAQTYCAPASEAPFVPTGFAAVGRFALPNLSPANWRWEIRPPAGTRFYCGASVPLFGQAGGGVEAMFPNGFSNIGPIANPVILASM